jgi:hypothetical protein
VLHAEYSRLTPRVLLHGTVRSCPSSVRSEGRGIGLIAAYEQLSTSRQTRWVHAGGAMLASARPGDA